MVIHKELIELLGYSVPVNEGSIVPFRIDADDTNCEVEFCIVDKDKNQKSVVRKGKHQNFIFNTSIDNIPLTINLKTGVLKKVRVHK